ncbi:MAG TPA: precorrin-6A reductase [Fibrobacteraceae bacterium]|nr:precorrin-6A reductase [Fibrobacteraceae bacterium]
MRTVLLIGGTSDAAHIAQRLLDDGDIVLHSAWSQDPVLPNHPHLLRRHGALDAEGFVQLARTYQIVEIVDASHPFACEVQRNARQAAQMLGLPYLRHERSEIAADWDDVLWARNHTEAAELAVRQGGPILLTIGSHSVAMYAQEALRERTPLFARILDAPESLRLCLNAGIPRERLWVARGPFSLEDNLAALKWSQARTLVSKDSGSEGGVPQKHAACHIAGVQMILVRRPKVQVESADI